MKRLLAVGSLFAVLALACTGEDACTEIGCDNDATVTYRQAVTEAYDLVVDTDDGSYAARCNDPGSPDAAANPPELACTANGFTLTGTAATGHAVRVSITTDAGDPLSEGTEVLLSVVEERSPNGPDCPPTCFSRVGDLLL